MRLRSHQPRRSAGLDGREGAARGNENESAGVAANRGWILRSGSVLRDLSSLRITGVVRAVAGRGMHVSGIRMVVERRRVYNTV